MTQIQPRIRICRTDEEDVLYTTDLDSLQIIQPERNTEWRDVGPFEVGTRISVGEDNYIISRISSNYFDQEFPNDPDVGINMYGIGESYPFNFQITYWVDEVND